MNKKINNENICRKCGSLMTKRWHHKFRVKMLYKNYIFVMWYYCDNCKNTYHFEKYKMYIDIDRDKLNLPPSQKIVKQLGNSTGSKTSGNIKKYYSNIKKYYTHEDYKGKTKEERLALNRLRFSKL